MENLGLRGLLRYGYTGFLCALVVTVMHGEWTKTLVKNLGSVLFSLAALAVGAAVYLLFKTLVGDLFLWGVLHRSHWTRTHCKACYLEETCEVQQGRGAAAYAFVRDTLLDDRMRERFHIEHSEGYILFLTAFVCGLVCSLVSLCVSSWALIQGRSIDFAPDVASCVAIGVLAFFVGLRHEDALCRAERNAILTIDQDELRRKLEEGEFVGNAGVVQAPPFRVYLLWRRLVAFILLLWRAVCRAYQAVCRALDSRP